MAYVYWSSKLGNKYLKEDIEKNDSKTKRQLDRLRRQPANHRCADCGSEPTVWASVNLGIFLCIRCGSLHRGVGTHISVPKGCTGTYFWGQDEIERMESVGNERAEVIYGGDGDRPNDNASHEVWRNFIVDKYYHRKFPSATCKSKIADSKKAPTTGSDLKEFGKQSYPSRSLINSPAPEAVKCRKSKASKRIITRLPSFKDDVPVGDLLGFDAEEYEPTMENMNNQVGEADAFSQAAKKDFRSDSNEAFPTKEESAGNFFAEFGL